MDHGGEEAKHCGEGTPPSEDGCSGQGCNALLPGACVGFLDHKGRPKGSAHHPGQVLGQGLMAFGMVNLCCCDELCKGGTQLLCCLGLDQIRQGLPALVGCVELQFLLCNPVASVPLP